MIGLEIGVREMLHLRKRYAAGERGGHAAEHRKTHAELGSAQRQALNRKCGQRGDEQNGCEAKGDGAPG